MYDEGNYQDLAATTTKGTTAAATAVHKFPLPTAATTTTGTTIRELATDIQLPGLSKQSNIPTGLSAHTLPTGTDSAFTMKI